ncbi:Glycine/D-amino acid oxidase [Poseidonocella pacifica]|uniref:Glycine/D-amino acid oxidase n=1 Tax=Poseidonocella pacifica TaxID=871651 RepID=A0A1I0WFV4_9RHOB|nr:FAD-binding oxidoreductase [Poseidonocella pacifica]SFA87639.1 Glycine/D-amino acid oxidase [Poseidonocella pacifica]
MSDIIIIGGGVAGLSAGYRLAPHMKVTVLEAEDALAYHASGRSAALFEKSYGPPAVVALNEASEDDYKKSGYLTPRGMMLVATAGEEDQYNADCVTLKMSPLSPHEAQEIVPVLNLDAVALAGYHEDAWDIDTDRMLQDYAKAIRQTGGTVQTRAKVRRITRGGQWRVDTDAGTFEADIILNAAGAWGDEVAAMAGVTPLGLEPRRRSMARIPAPGGHDISRWPMIMGAGESWYCKPDAGQLIVSPADADPVEPHDVWAEDLTLAEGLARYEAMVTEPVTRMTSNWAGLRTFAPDGVLCLGPATGHQGFFFSAAQGGYGFQTAPAASRLIADLILGRPSELDATTVAALSPGRFA